MTTVIAVNGVIAVDTKVTLCLPSAHKNDQIYAIDCHGIVHKTKRPEVHFYKTKLRFDHRVPRSYVMAGAGATYQLDLIHDAVNELIDISNAAESDGVSMSNLIRVCSRLSIADTKSWGNSSNIYLHRSGGIVLVRGDNCASSYLYLTTYKKEKEDLTHDDVISDGSGGSYCDVALPYVDISDPLAAVHIATICSSLDKDSGGDIHYVRAAPLPEVSEDVKNKFETALQSAVTGRANELILEEFAEYKKSIDPMKREVFTIEQQRQYLESVKFNFKYIRNKSAP